MIRQRQSMIRHGRLIAILLAISACFAFAVTVQAHQPYFEEKDLTPDDPWPIKDPSVSTVVYASLIRDDDVDYFAFKAEAGETILLALTIPQIPGQEEFAPTMAILGPGFDEEELPANVYHPHNSGALLIPPPPGTPSTFYEPFSRTSYWERQEELVTMPASGEFLVAVWHADGMLGRYGFVVGQKERLGGDIAFGQKLKDYWKPISQASADDNVGAAEDVEPRKLWQRLLHLLQEIFG